MSERQLDRDSEPAESSSQVPPDAAREAPPTVDVVEYAPQGLVGLQAYGIAQYNLLNETVCR